MSNVRLVALAIAGFLLLVIIMNNLRRRQSQRYEAPEVGDIEYFSEESDDVLGIKKTTNESAARPVQVQSQASQSRPVSQAQGKQEDEILVIHCVSKDSRGFAGYELLQELLSCGLRYGDMNIFHFFREEEGVETVQFSVASADEPGTFDLDQMGAYQCRGLSLFMRCKHDGQDANRYQIMQSTAQTLADELEGELINKQRQIQDAVA